MIMTHEKLEAIIEKVQEEETEVSASAIENFVYGDWSEGQDHLNWLDSASVAEIVSWVRASGFWEVE